MQADSGRSAWTFRPPPSAANSFAMVHGGVLGLLAHEVASDAQRSLIGPGEELIPLDLVVNFYRGIPASDRLAAATAQVTHRGRRFVVAEGEVTGPDGRPALRLWWRPGPQHSRAQPVIARKRLRGNVLCNCSWHLPNVSARRRVHLVHEPSDDRDMLGEYMLSRSSPRAVSITVAVACSGEVMPAAGQAPRAVRLMLTRR